MHPTYLLLAASTAVKWKDKCGVNTASSLAAVPALHELWQGFIPEVRYTRALSYMTALNALKYMFKCFADAVHFMHFGSI